VGELVAQQITPEEQARRHRAVLHHMLARRMRDDGQIPQALHEARRGVRLVPGFAPGSVLAAELAVAQGKMRQARRMLEDAWRAAPHPELARAYAQLVPNEAPEQRLRRVENGLKSLRPDHPEFHVAVGELAIVAEQWEAARNALERALSLEPTVRVYRLLAELERAIGNTVRAEEWLARGADASPDNAWVCEDTGEVVPEWRPFGASGRFDVVRWTTPPRFATLQGHEHGAFLVAERPAEPAQEEPPARKPETQETEPPPPPPQPADRPAAEMAATA
jgi:HemY protein